MAKADKSEMRGPGRPATMGERIALGLRVTKETKRKLDDAVYSSGRSQSQEAEFRLEQTFNADNSLFAALDLAYGRRWSGIVLAIAHAAQLAGVRSMMINHWNFEGGEDWVLDPYAYDQAVKAANAILEAFRPKGEIALSPVSDFSRYPVSMFENLGKGFAEDLLTMLKEPNDKRADAEITRAIAQRVADLLPNVRKDVAIPKPKLKRGN